MADANDGTEDEFEVEMVLKKRMKNNVVEYFVKWKGYPDSDCTWEPAHDLNCPDLLKQFHDRLAGPSITVKKEGSPPPVKAIVKSVKELASIVKKEKKPEVRVKEESEDIDEKKPIVRDVKPKLATGRPSIRPCKPITGKAAGCAPTRPTRRSNGTGGPSAGIEQDENGRTVSMKPMNGLVKCERPYGFERGQKITAVSGYKMENKQLFYRLAYGDREEWTPSEWAEKPESGLSYVLVPYYKQILQKLQQS